MGENSADMILNYTFKFNIVMCQDTCEPICYKLGMMLDSAILFSLSPV